MTKQSILAELKADRCESGIGEPASVHGAGVCCAGDAAGAQVMRASAKGTERK